VTLPVRIFAALSLVAALLLPGRALAQENPCVGEYVALCFEPSLTLQLLPVGPILEDGAIAFELDRICVLPGSCPGP
jgi:hypothetical protein